MWISIVWFCLAMVVVTDQRIHPVVALWLLVVGLAHVHCEQKFFGRRIKTAMWVRRKLTTQR